MTAASPEARMRAPNVNGLFLSAWNAAPSAPVIDDGSTMFTMTLLARRIAALSCFIDEAAGAARGPVLLYMPAGEAVVSAFLGILATGRAALPIDAIPEAHLSEAEPSRACITPGELPDLSRLAEPPSLVVTLRPFERILMKSSNPRILEDYPVLYAGEIANRMDPGHQEIIRERTLPEWFHERAHMNPATPAILAEGKALTHAELARAVENRIALWGSPAPRRFLCTAPLARLGSWAGAYLPAVALAGEMRFMRLYYPPHVARMLVEDEIDMLMMTAEQYEAMLLMADDLADSVKTRFWCDREPSAGLREAWLEATDRELEWAPSE